MLDPKPGNDKSMEQKKKCYKSKYQETRKENLNICINSCLHQDKALVLEALMKKKISQVD